MVSVLAVKQAVKSISSSGVLPTLSSSLVQDSAKNDMKTIA